MLKKPMTDLSIIRGKLVIILYRLNNSTSSHSLVFMLIILQFLCMDVLGQGQVAGSHKCHIEHLRSIKWGGIA